jgi:hypothetical protein
MWTRHDLDTNEIEFSVMIISLQKALLSRFVCCDILMNRLISVVLWTNSIKTGDIDGFIINYCLGLKRNQSVSWRGQLVACHILGLGSIHDQTIRSFWWTKFHWGSVCPPCQYYPVIAPKSCVFYLPLKPSDLSNWQRVWYTVRSHYYLPFRFFIFPSMFKITRVPIASSRNRLMNMFSCL